MSHMTYFTFQWMNVKIWSYQKKSDQYQFEFYFEGHSERFKIVDMRSVMSVTE